MKTNEHNSLQRRQQESLAPTKSTYHPPTSLNDAVNRKQDFISVIRKQKSKELLKWIKGRLIQVLTYLGIFGKVSDYQVLTLAQRICDKYYYLTPTELDYFFIAFTNGEYRKLYGSDTFNPQDIMKSLIDYENDLLVARGVAEQKRQDEEEARKKEEEKKRPHGWEAWKLYCKKNGFNPDTHTIHSVKLHNINEELYPKKQ